MGYLVNGIHIKEMHTMSLLLWRSLLQFMASPAFAGSSAAALPVAASAASLPAAASLAALPVAGPVLPALLLVGVIVALGAIFSSGKAEDEVSGEAIRDLRKRKNLTQEELASVLGVGIATIRRWEAGTAKPTGNNDALLRQLMATPDAQNPVRLETEYPTAWEDMLRLLLADGKAKRILASRILSVDLLGSEVQQNPFPQILRLLQGGNSMDQIEPALPFPRTSVERSSVRQGELKGVVDAVLLERFKQEQEARGLTESKMLETILWKYFEYPGLSFQPQATDAASNGPVCSIEQLSIDDNREP
jgi:transcriptional regulator with XRE-family HTH domain